MFGSSIRLIRLSMVFVVALILTLGIGVSLTGAWGAQPQNLPTTLTVTNTNDGGTGSLRAAINAASPGDTINFAVSGVITLTSGQLTISKTLTIDGPGANLLTIDGDHASRVFNIISGTVVIFGVTVADGTALSPDHDGWGGGIYSADGVNLLMVGCMIRNNTAQLGGGGVYSRGPLALHTSMLVSNTVTAQIYLGGGGGLYANSTLSLTDTQFLNNVGTASGGGAFAQGTATLNGGLFQNNADIGLYANGTLSLTGTQFISNKAGGAYAVGAATVNGGLFQDNAGIGLQTGSTLSLTGTQFIGNKNVGAGASGAVTLNGGLFQNNSSGGLWTYNALSMTGTQFIGNTGTGGHVGAHAQGAVTVNGGLFQNNTGGDNGGGLYTSGSLSLTGTRFISNTAVQNGGGAWAGGPVTLNGGVFEGNQATSGGGLFANATAVANGTQFTGNAASQDGGAVYGNDTLTLNRDLFVNNLASRHGGGIAHANNNATIINSLFARNTAALSGPALYFGSTGMVQLTHVTIGSPSLANGTAIHIVTGTLYLGDTIIANHFIGVQNAGGTVVQDYNLYYGNSANTVGPIAGGTHNASGDPKFVNVAQDNYHLSAGSAAIDTGVNLGVTTDFDGDPRPYGAGYDIGYDEYVQRYLYLPVVLK